MVPDTRPPDPHTNSERHGEGSNKFVCYICSTDLTAKSEGADKDEKRKSKKGERAEVKPGLVELRCDGTGFAGGGDNMVQKQGTAFQC